MNKENGLDNAFLETDFHWVRSLQSIWSDPPSHVGSLHRDIADNILKDFSRLYDQKATSAIGRVINGPAGSGKTHLFGTLRHDVWEENGWFILIDIVGINKEFWRTVALGFIRSLRQLLPDGRSQYQAVFEAALHCVPIEKRKSIVKENQNLEASAIAAVNLFVKLLQAEFPEALDYSNIIERCCCRVTRM